MFKKEIGDSFLRIGGNWFHTSWVGYPGERLAVSFDFPGSRNGAQVRVAKVRPKERGTLVFSKGCWKVVFSSCNDGIEPTTEETVNGFHGNLLGSVYVSTKDVPTTYQARIYIYTHMYQYQVYTMWTMWIVGSTCVSRAVPASRKTRFSLQKAPPPFALHDLKK